MNPWQNIFGGSLLAMVAGAAVFLSHVKTYQHLGPPGIKTRPIPGQVNCDLIIPETLPGYTSEALTNNESTLRDALPGDSSFQVRAYHGNDGFFSELSVVLMGADRTSIHNPEICMPSQGWDIDSQLTSVDNIHMDSPFAYDLPVNRIITTKVFKDESGKPQTVRGIYVYWYVDGSRYTEKAWKWKLWYVPRDLILHGVLERWAYISLFSSCLPGQEEATFDQMKKLIAEAVPQFQLVPRPAAGD